MQMPTRIDGGEGRYMAIFKIGDVEKARKMELEGDKVSSGIKLEPNQIGTP